MNQRGFQRDISAWDTSNRWRVDNVTDMRSASSFNQPLSDWRVDNVTMNWMFRSASSFNQPLNDWRRQRHGYGLDVLMAPRPFR